MAWATESSTDYHKSEPTSAPQTAFSNANDAFERARTLSARVSALVDRMCGTQPSEATGQSIKGGGSVLSKLRDDADSTHEAISRAMRQLDRLESEIP